MTDDLELAALRENGRKAKELLEKLSGVKIRYVALGSGVSIRVSKIKVKAKVIEPKVAESHIKIRLEPKNE